METPTLNVDEQLKCYRLLLEGKHDQVECRYSNDTPWLPVSPNMAVRVPGNEEMPTIFRFRLKPPKYRPWKVEEVPLGAVVRSKYGQEFLIVGRKGAYNDSVFISEPNEVTGGWQSFTLDETCQYSTDCGKTWLPCGVLE